MPIHITMNDAATYGADYLNRALNEDRKAQIRPASKYNLLVKVFNASSILLVAAAVTALFLSFTTSFVFLAMGLFLRITSEREIDKYTAPYQAAGAAEQAPAQGAGAQLWERLRGAFQTNLLRHALQQTTEAEKRKNIYDNIGLPEIQEWVRDEVTFLDFTAWKNSVVIPEVIERVVPAQEEAAPQPAEPQAPARGGLAGLVRGMLGQQQQPPGAHPEAHA